MGAVRAVLPTLTAMRTLQTHDGLPLHWRQWHKPGPDPAHGTVSVVHGLGEHIGRYEALAAGLNAAGWQVAGYDQRRHGLSSGARVDLPEGACLQHDLARVIDALLDGVGPATGPLLLFGHSMGGKVAARFVAGGLTANSAGA